MARPLPQGLSAILPCDSGLRKSHESRQHPRQKKPTEEVSMLNRRSLGLAALAAPFVSNAALWD
jgi:hypothetical protein